MVPLQIRITDHEANLTAADVPYGVSVVRDMEFAFIVDVDGEMQIMTPYEFACHDASCRPPGSGGTGGSRKAGTAKGAAGGIDSESQFYGGGNGTIGGGGGASRHVGGSDHDADMRTIISEDKDPFLANHINKDGTLGVAFTKPGGAGTIEFDAKTQAWVDNKLKELGVTHEELVGNLVKAGLDAIDSPLAAKAITWYDTENQWGTNLGKTYGVSNEVIFATTSALSAMRKWGNEGTGTNGPSTNKGAIETILKKLHDDEPFEITQAVAVAFNTHKGDKASLGANTKLEPGTYKPSDLSSVTMARLATSLGWKIIGPAGTRPVAAGIAMLRGEISPNDMVRGTKQRSFISNLSHPEIDYTSTNDLWHFRAVAGNSKFIFADRRKQADLVTPVVPGKGNKTGPITMKEYESHITGRKKKKNKDGTVTVTPDRGNAPHDIFTGGPPHGGLYPEVTKITRHALDTLKTQDVRFKSMKMHEFQALVWKYAGGNSAVNE